MGPLSDQLLVNGPLGLVCLILLYAVRHLYKALENERAQHREEIKALMERHIGKAETWVEKGHELANSLNSVLTSLAKRSSRAISEKEDR